MMKTWIWAGLAAWTLVPPGPEGEWRAALDLAGGPLRFGVTVQRSGNGWTGKLCNGSELPAALGRAATRRQPGARDRGLRRDHHRRPARGLARRRLSERRQPRAAHHPLPREPWTVARRAGAGRGFWAGGTPPIFGDFGTSPRVFELRNGHAGLEGTMISNTGDYGHFAGPVTGTASPWRTSTDRSSTCSPASCAGDTLRGTFHAGLRTQTPWMAVRSTGAPHLTPPTEVTQADTSARFRFAFPDLNGKMVTEDDPRFQGKVVLVDMFGTLVPDLPRRGTRRWCVYTGSITSAGSQIVGLAYEVTGDRAIDGRQVRRYRDKFDIPFPLLLAGVNDVRRPRRDAAAAPGLHRRSRRRFSWDGTGRCAESTRDSTARRRRHSTRGWWRSSSGRSRRLLADDELRTPAALLLESSRSGRRLRIHPQADVLPGNRVPGDPTEQPVPSRLVGDERGLVRLSGGKAGRAPCALIALSNAGRPPSVGSFSRSAMTTRLCGALESADCQFQRTVQSSGTTTWTPPSL